MALPAGLNTVTVTGTFTDAVGNPQSGTVSFTPSCAVADTATGTVIEPVPVVCKLQKGLFGSPPLVATDNAGLSPSGWMYRVNFQIEGKRPWAFYCAIPYSAAPVNMTSLAPATSLGPVQVQVLPADVPLPLSISLGGTGQTSAAAALAALGGTGDGTVTGPLTITAAGTTGAVTPPPYGYGDSASPTGLVVTSSYPSDDVSGGTDGTGRINLYSYQRANAYSFGETIRNFLMRWDAKAMTAWYGPTAGTSGAFTAAYDGSGNATGTNYQPWTWVGSHYEANDHNSIHGHWEVEVPDSTGALQGRLTILFANTTTGAIGLDKTTIGTNLADFHVFCHGTDHTGTYQEQFFRLTGAAGFEKAIEWNNDNAGSQANRRWKIAANSTAETGANAGTDFQLFRYDDSGNLLDTPITVTRSNGLVTIGGTSGTTNGLQVNRATGVAVKVTQTGSSATGFGAVLADTSGTAFEAQVSGDAVQRFTLLSTGQLSWGDGSDSRDLNLYRSAAGLLRTDNSMEVATSLGVGGVPASGHRLDVSNSSAGLMATFSRSSTSDSSPVVQMVAGDTSTSSLLALSVNGDSVNRFAVDPTGKIAWGDGTDARDTNLYRSSAGHVKTDFWLSAVEGLLVNTTSVAGGVGVVALADAATPPSGTPSGGGVLYSSGGVPHWLNSSGGDFGLLPANVPRESDLSYAAWAYDPVAAANSTAPTSGTVYAALVQVRTNVTVSKVIIGVSSTSGMSLTSGDNFAAIFNSSGTQVGVTADLTSAITASGEVALSLTGNASLTPGFYWLALLLNGTTPTLARGEAVIPALGSGQSGSSKRRFGTITTGVTAMPSSFTPSSMSTSAAVTFWMATA